MPDKQLCAASLDSKTRELRTLGEADIVSPTPPLTSLVIGLRAALAADANACWLPSLAAERPPWSGGTTNNLRSDRSDAQSPSLGSGPIETLQAASRFLRSPAYKSTQAYTSYGPMRTFLSESTAIRSVMDASLISPSYGGTPRAARMASLSHRVVPSTETSCRSNSEGSTICDVIDRSENATLGAVLSRLVGEQHRSQEIGEEEGLQMDVAEIIERATTILAQAIGDVLRLWAATLTAASDTVADQATSQLEAVHLSEEL